MPFFRTPLRDARAVEYRHQAQRDLEDEAPFRADGGVRAPTAGDARAPGPVRQAPHRYQKEHWILAAASVYCRTVAALVTGPSA